MRTIAQLAATWWKRGRTKQSKPTEILQMIVDTISGAVHVKDDPGAIRYYKGGDPTGYAAANRWVYRKAMDGAFDTVPATSSPFTDPDFPLGEFCGKMRLVYISDAENVAHTATVEVHYQIDDGNTYVRAADNLVLTHRKEVELGDVGYRPVFIRRIAQDNDGFIYVAPV